MELIKNIFFNTDKIVSNSKLKISYVGALYQNNSEQVFLHYGFGLNWDNINDIEMNKTELGFQCEIPIEDSESLNLCFRNSNDEWDNNEGLNYIFPIEESAEDEVEIEDKNEELSLVEVKDSGMQIHKGLRKTYIWSKKVRIAVYKIMKFFPKLISGNYKRKITEE